MYELTPYRQNQTIGDLMLRIGEAQAQGQMRKGDIIGNTVGSLGSIASGYIQDRAAAKAEAAKFAAEAPLRADADEKRRLELENLRRTGSEKDAERMKAQQLSDLFTRGDPKPEEILGIVGPERGVAIVKGLDILKPDGIKKYDEVHGVIRDAAQGVLAVPAPLRPEAYGRMRAGLISHGVATEKDIPEAYDEAFVMSGANFGQAPKAEEQPRVVGRSLVGPDGKVIYRDPESKPSGSDNKIWVMRPGPDGKMKTVFVAESQVQPGDQPANTRTGEGRPSIGGEKSALGFFNRAKQADEELSNLTKQISEKGLGGQAWMAAMPNFLQTQEGQAYQQAQRAFTEARLRKDSGAAIPETEFANDRKTYFVQPGDSKETIAQKERGRAAVLASLAFQSGRALNEFYGDEAEPLLEGYKSRQGGSAKVGTGKNQRLTATNPKTGEKIVSDDNGATWRPFK